MLINTYKHSNLLNSNFNGTPYSFVFRLVRDMNCSYYWVISKCKMQFLSITVSYICTIAIRTCQLIYQTVQSTTTEKAEKCTSYIIISWNTNVNIFSKFKCIPLKPFINILFHRPKRLDSLLQANSSGVNLVKGPFTQVPKFCPCCDVASSLYIETGFNTVNIPLMLLKTEELAYNYSC